MSELSDLAQALSGLKEQDAKVIVKKAIGEGVSATDILAQCHEGMSELGRRFDCGEAFIPELIVAGKIMENLMVDLEPLLKDAAETVESAGCVVMGTVLNDVHDIGKDIVIMMLKGAGFEVVDLGINAPPEKFVQAIQDHNPSVVGMSVLLTTRYKSIMETVGAIEKAGLRDDVSIMLGGAAATDLLAEKTGCDYYGKTAIDGLNYATEITEAVAN